MLSVFSDFLVKFLGQAVPFVLRWYYSPNKIAEKVKVRISSEGSGIELWGGELPFARAWLEITNLSPFHIRFDRIYGNFWYGTRLAAFFSLQQHSVGPSQEIRVFLEADLTTPQADYIRKNAGKKEAKLTLGALGECKVNRFEINREIRTNNLRLANFNVPA